jgi:magnesium-transporting ATPase (P-type)
MQLMQARELDILVCISCSVFPGDKVPADLRLVVCKTATLRAEQSSLTGEPQAVLKGVEAVADANCELQVRLGLGWL